MESSRFNYEAYKEHAAKISERFEKRRAVFLRQFRIHMVAAALILLLMPFGFSLLSVWDTEHSSFLSEFWQTVVNMLAGLVIVILVIIFAMLPVFRYRHYKLQHGTSVPGIKSFAEQDVSLKSEIFTHLLSFFGEFTLHSEKKLSLKQFFDAPHMPEFDEFISEDYVQGRLNDVEVEITEARLIRRLHQSDIVIFNGLMVIIDVDDTKQLRGHFDGKTILISDRPKELDYVASKYKNYRRIKLPDAAFEQRFEAFATDEEEADRLVKPDLLRAILKLSDTVKTARHQYLSMDEKLAHRLGHLASSVADILLLVGTRLTLWLQTGSFRMASSRHTLTLPDMIQDDARAFNQCIHATFYRDKLIITVPYSHNLFEPDSLLRPPLHDDDIEMSYHLMSSISTIIDHTLPALHHDDI